MFQRPFIRQILLTGIIDSSLMIQNNEKVVEFTFKELCLKTCCQTKRSKSQSINQEQPKIGKSATNHSIRHQFLPAFSRIALTYLLGKMNWPESWEKMGEGKRNDQGTGRGSWLEDKS